MKFSLFQTKTYDAVTEKFMDFSFEKTHSAYMLFYERSEPGKQPMYEPPQITASKEYAEWIWKDNMQFLHDKHIFDTSYFNFMWHLCCGVSSGMGDSAEVHQWLCIGFNIIIIIIIIELSAKMMTIYTII